MVLQLGTEVVGAPAVGSSLAESCGLVMRREGVFSEDPRILEQAIQSSGSEPESTCPSCHRDLLICKQTPPATPRRSGRSQAALSQGVCL